MDYLNVLPVEIWLDILTEAASFINVPPDPHTHLSLLRERRYPYEQAKQLQPRRLALTLVCKSFHQLAEPLLYTEIVLSERNQFAKFQAVSATKIFYAQPCVNLTRSIFIYWKASSVLRDPQFPHNIFPNLISLVAYAFQTRLCSYWGTGIGEKPPPLTHTTFGPIGIEQTRKGRRRPSELRPVSLSDSMRPMPIENGSHFPLNALRSLNLRQRDFVFSDILQLELPSLMFLYLELVQNVGTFSATHKFLEKHGKQLVELELSIHPMSRPIIFVPCGLFDMCTALKKLSFTAQLLEPIMFTREGTVIPFQAPSNLVMFVDPVRDKVRIEGSFLVIRDRFPNLSLITFVFDNCDDVAIQDSFRTSVLTLDFPGIDLAFEK